MARILVIEDNPANMKLATLLLTNVGHSVLSAVDAESGLIIARNEKPDLILMDIQLPGMDGLAATVLLKKDLATFEIPVIALTAMAMKEDQEKTKVAGCDDYIAKPLRYQEFYRVIDQHLLKAAANSTGNTKKFDSLVARQTIKYDTAADVPGHHLALHAGQRILVAEDNVLNQKLISRQLALLGFVADVVSDGLAAYESWETEQYVLLLTDLHMPEMNGFELTAAIRMAENGLRRMPIIALTATASNDEADQCLAAGMDQYLGKPLRIADLKAALETWLPIAQCDLPMHGELEIHAASSPVVDKNVLVSLVGNDPLIISEFQNDFQVSAAKIANELEVAYIAGSALRVSEQAHKLTASAYAVGARVLGDLCAQMETAGKAGSVESLSVLLPLFERELQAVNYYFYSLPSSQKNRQQEEYKTGASDIRILVLDDEAFMHKLLAHMLAGLGHESVRTLESGIEALNLLEDVDSAPNLILLDLNMPGMDGIEFVRKLVDHKYQGSLILVSGEDERVLQMAEKLVKAHHISVLGHLKKPVSLDGLEKLINKWRPIKISSVTKKSYLYTELEAAIRSGDLVNYYQPKASVTTGAITGVETLVRWRHPQDGLVLPDMFIHLAEANGLIDELTRVVFVSAMQQTKLWQQEGLNLRVSVNVSMENLRAVTFADFIADTAGAYGISPQNILLEVTESQLMVDHRMPLEVLTRLRLKRFGLSIDDFGTGHSSLTQLHDISFNELKIDRSFVHGAWRDETLLAMYGASLGLGKQLGMEVVAEGVEDRDDWEFLRRSGCDLAQGYFIAHPMPAEALPAWIELWNSGLRCSLAR